MPCYEVPELAEDEEVVDWRDDWSRRVAAPAAGARTTDACPDPEFGE